jgi:hypothetical protein
VPVMLILRVKALGYSVKPFHGYCQIARFLPR